jgi:hypothetical protein
MCFVCGAWTAAGRVLEPRCANTSSVFRACVHIAYAMRSAPPMYGRSTAGTSIEPSAFW